MTIGDTGGRVRASDAEREQYARIVREAIGEGRLTLDEGDGRLARVYAARYRDELPGLIADLPAGRPSPPPTEVERRPERARRLGYQPYGWFFVAPPVTVLFVAAMVVGLSALTGHFFWPAIPLIFFIGLALLRRAGARRWHR